jgi:hypothetical protein
VTGRHTPATIAFVARAAIAGPKPSVPTSATGTIAMVNDRIITSAIGVVSHEGIGLQTARASPMQQPMTLASRKPATGGYRDNRSACLYGIS